MRAAPALGVVVALALAAALRLPGLDGGLPQKADPDSLFVRQAERFEHEEEQGSARVSDLYPFLLGRILAALPGPLLPEAPVGAPLGEHLAAASWNHLAARWLVALLSLLTVPATILLARRHLPEGWAFLAGVLGATSLLTNLLAHQARPHAPLVAFMTWAVVAAGALARAPSLPRVLFCALTTALALGTLHSGAAVLPAVALAGAIAAVRGGRETLLELVAIPLAVVGALFFFYPFLLESRELWAGRPWPEDVLGGAGFARTARTLWAHEPVLCALAGAAVVLGTVTGRVRRIGHRGWTDLAVLAAFAVPYAVAIGLYYKPWHRFALPLVPVLAIAAAAGAREITGLVARCAPGSARPAAIAVGVLAAAFPTATAARLAWLYARPTSTDRAAEWIREHLDPSAARIAASSNVSLPLAQTVASVVGTPAIWRTPWQRYLHRRHLAGHGSPETPLVSGTGWDVPSLWVRPDVRATEDPSVLSSLDVQRRLRKLEASHALVRLPATPTLDGRDQTREAVIEFGGERVAEIVPYRSSVLQGTRGGRDQLDWEPLAIVWRARWLGQALEIYELPEEPLRRRDRKDEEGDDPGR